MKKYTLTSFILLVTSLSIHAQDTFFTDSLRRGLTQLLVNKNIAINTKMQNYDPLIIRNLSTMEIINENSATEEDKFGIYDFHSELQVLAYSLILIRNGDQYDVLDVINESCSEMTTELTDYFARHSNVPNELFSLYTNAINRVRKEYSHLEETSGIQIEKGKLNNSIYQFIMSSNGSVVELEEIID